MKRLSFAMVAITAVLGCPAARSQSIRTNPGFASQSIPRNDDGSGPLVPLGFSINFFGKIRSSVYVNNNGNITFDSALATFTPFGLQNTQREIIAPFFADVDTRALGSNVVTYGKDTVNGHKAFGANFLSVGYFAEHADKLNTFQVVLVDRTETGAGNFDIEFNYAHITWETGDASGGHNGFGGVPAVVGWSNGTSEPGTSFELPGSMISGAFLDNGPRALIRLSLNTAISNASSAVPGRLIFRARDGVISPGLGISNGALLPDGTLGTAYSTALTASGAKPPFRWTLLPDVTAPPGLTFTPNGVLAGTPTATGTYSFTLSVTATTEDGDLTVSQRGSITINPPVVSIVTACPLDDATVGSPFSVTLRATGSSSGYTWSVDDLYSLPPGVGLSASGRLAGTPLVPGTYLFNLHVRASTSNGSQPAQSSCRLNVMPAAVRLTSGCLLPTATVSVPYTQVLSADGGFGPYRFEPLGQLPLGLALTPDGSISGTPLVAADYPFQVSVKDTRGLQTTQDCSITVDPAAFSVPSACPLPSAVTGSPYTAKLSDGYTWSLSGTLPAGLALSPDGGISGTPMAAGPSRFLLIATDSAGHQAGQPCSLAVTRGPLSVSGCPLPGAATGEPYHATLGAVGGSAPYVFAFAGTLPAGISASVDGLVDGTAGAAGSYPFTVVLRDGSGQTTTQACNLTISAPSLHFSTSCPLPQGRLGENYSANIEASGGVAPYQFDFFGFLPDGLRVVRNGSISGTPTAVGGQTFLVQVTDAANQSLHMACSVSVGLPKLPQISIGDLPSTAPPAATNLAITVQLDRPFTAPIEGQLVLSIQPNTRSSEVDANVADPRLALANGQSKARFTIAPGATQVVFPLVSTGTVASTVTVSVQDLRTSGVDLTVYPTPKTFSIAPAAPAVTSACYTRTPTAVTLQINGYSTTRELTRAEVSAGTQTYTQKFRTDVSGTAASFFSAPETVRAGGTFALTLPYDLNIVPAAPLASVTLNLFNTVGGTGTQSLRACQ